jgi:hypothetical protein
MSVDSCPIVYFWVIIVVDCIAYLQFYCRKGRFEYESFPESE